MPEMSGQLMAEQSAIRKRSSKSCLNPSCVKGILPFAAEPSALCGWVKAFVFNAERGRQPAGDNLCSQVMGHASLLWGGA